MKRRNIAFFGLKRSGNHALQNWILNQIPEKTCVFNQTKMGLNPIVNHHFRTLRADLSGGTYDGPVENNSIFYTYENSELQKIPDGISMGINNLLSMGPFDYSANIMVLRDPFNMMASLFRMSKRRPRHLGDLYNYIDLWKVYAKEFLGITSFLEDSGLPLPPERRQRHGKALKVCISYNDWFTSEEYRRGVSKNLRLEFSDEGLQRVATFGGGSSFDLHKYENGQKMKVLERWRQLEDFSKWKVLFNALLADDELVGLAKEIFNDHVAEIIERRHHK